MQRPSRDFWVLTPLKLDGKRCGVLVKTLAKGQTEFLGLLRKLCGLRKTN
jgi:hypothetical protein